MKIKWFSLIRITGLLLVLFYHFYQKFLPGGFIGVDVFFVFSGFLITSLMIDEFIKTEKFDLLSYMRRRFYRILPPLVLMILLVLPFTFLVTSDFRANIDRQIIYALGFTTNIYEILLGSSYESQFIPHLFLHTWSLAVEVHFYIFWALFIWYLSGKVKNSNQFRGIIFLSSAAFFLLSFISMFIRTFFATNLSSIYYSSISHSFPFFLGAMAASLTGISDVTKRFKTVSQSWSVQKTLIQLISSFLVLLLLGFFLHHSSKVTYFIGILLAAIAAVTMIYSARVLHEKTEDIEEPRVLGYLADISYGIYLFHWPFYVIFSQLSNHTVAVVLTLILSFVLATLSYYIIEPWIIGKPARLFGLEFMLADYIKPVKIVSSLLLLISLVIIVLAPKMGSFEEGLLVSSLKQTQSTVNRLNQTLVGDSDAQSSVLVIGDSVALRAESQFANDLSEASLDASVSRNFTEAFDLMQTYIDSDSLPQTIVIAVGVNSIGNYQSDTDQFVTNLPKGHRLIFVTPYNSRDISGVKAVRDYELDLAAKNDFVTVADWFDVSRSNSDIWSGTDGVHFSQATDKGSQLYVSTIKEAIQEASKKSPKE